jgi:hypothetical protein
VTLTNCIVKPPKYEQRLSMTLEAQLPTLYAPWLRTIVDGPIPAETQATCDHCAMLPSGGSSSDALYFHPDTKCCAFQPNLPNFLAGRILSEADPSMIAGRTAVETRVARRVAIKPSGVTAGAVFSLLYGATPQVFGRAPALRCHYLTSEGNCGVWKHRPGVCATWFCKYVRGGTGSAFWKLADKLLREVERDLAHWCMAQFKIGLGEVAEVTQEPSPHVSELEGEIDWTHYRRLWGNWVGREIEFYLASARLVEGLSWRQVQVKCGPRVGILAELVRDAYNHLTSAAIPERLRMNEVRLKGFKDGNYLVVGYSPFDPLLMPERLAQVLHYFDGRATEEALQAIRVEQSVQLDSRLVRRLVDFGILESWDAGGKMFPIVS